MSKAMIQWKEIWFIKEGVTLLRLVCTFVLGAILFLNLINELKNQI
jgi:hypothetical protein